MTPVVVAGEALVDLVRRPDGAFEAHPGGGPFNAARTIARLGVPCRFLGRLSRDRFGRLLRKTLADDGVGLDLVEGTDDPTTLAVAELDPDGAATYRFYVEGTAAPGLSAARLPPGTGALLIGTLGLRLEPIGTALEGLATRAPAGILVMLDVNARPSLPGDPAAWRARIHRLATRADVVKASRDDLAFLRATESDLLAGGTRAVLVTDGPRPVEAWTRAARIEEPVPAVTLVDTVGAGDAFAGAFLARWLACRRSRDDLASADHLRDALRLAGAVAASTCEQPGAQPPRREEVEAFDRC